jgi:CTP:molybdopterin cytidylyltransferase MocA
MNAGDPNPPFRPGLAGVILAAGESRRMGRPKALLAAPGSHPPESFLDRMIGLLAAHSAPVVVVLGAHSDAIRGGAARASEATFVMNERYREGQLSSLQCGLRAVPEEAVGVIFTPVDFPRVLPGTVADVVAAFWREGGSGLVIPRHQGMRGHPVCAARRFIPEFLALPEGAQAREVIHRHAGEACYVDVDDPGILRDVDDPEAYRSVAELP